MSPTKSDQPLPCRTCGYDLCGAPTQHEMVRCPECSAITPRWLLSSGPPARRTRVVLLRAVGPVFAVVTGLLGWAAAEFAGRTRDPRPFDSVWGMLVLLCILVAAVIAPVWAAASSRRPVTATLWIILGGWFVNAVLIGIGVVLWGFLAVTVGGLPVTGLHAVARSLRAMSLFR